MAEHRYLIGLGSNMRHVRHGAPAQVLHAALAQLAGDGLAVEVHSPIVNSAPLGPSHRRYANAAAIVRTWLEPEALLAHLKQTEASFGRRAGGMRWRARVLDLDIILWSEGAYAAPGLVIPHPEFRHRAFVLQPASHIAPRWRDPLTGLTLAHLTARVTRPLDPGA
ncbi:2-amino-4-hydroxy-6-hydroxymethyldihydropteridine diphosphokinase [Novosphingobium chloroacetimidivorans]|uniref:2-amino-4-hydroxy-6-hydroxymethyldihydropteridine pyrophosphokinase n=1 Tax=Novosphingobium chloroacetimidivorans TaxID=1428314 RepID=A0A7W7NVY7_9SPHN|nr:2-amino-4-hydroxy-6-hydroxymethyldihydropteridine diphosphokinase [Novosphingobium chloroacetimidivorans]MBB4857570.1 2-amino-4-hydroxy-6-hydroxymethyldihydropteridine diphosphokinase [Novosphingobium chloroacetimidivorans]